MEKFTEVISKAITEEVESYLALNGEVGGWGESMRDYIGVDTICEAIEEGHDIEVTPKVRKEVEKLLFSTTI